MMTKPEADAPPPDLEAEIRAHVRAALRELDIDSRTRDADLKQQIETTSLAKDAVIERKVLDVERVIRDEIQSRYSDVQSRISGLKSDFSDRSAKVDGRIDHLERPFWQRVFELRPTNLIFAGIGVLASTSLVVFLVFLFAAKMIDSRVDAYFFGETAFSEDEGRFFNRVFGANTFFFEVDQSLLDSLQQARADQESIDSTLLHMQFFLQDDSGLELELFRRAFEKRIDLVIEEVQKDQAPGREVELFGRAQVLRRYFAALMREGHFDDGLDRFEELATHSIADQIVTQHDAALGLLDAAIFNLIQTGSTADHPLATDYLQTAGFNDEDYRQEVQDAHLMLIGVEGYAMPSGNQPAAGQDLGMSIAVWDAQALTDSITASGTRSFSPEYLSRLEGLATGLRDNESSDEGRARFNVLLNVIQTLRTP